MSAASGARFDTATEEAIDWLVLLRSGEAGAPEHGAFERWLHSDARHRAAWQRLAGRVDHAFGIARASQQQRPPGQADALVEALSGTGARVASRRRMLRGALAVAGTGVATGLVAQRFVPLQDSFADLRTATGERRLFTLADGSTLLLNARSAVDVAFADGQRTVHLRSGEVIASVQPQARSVFALQCRHGRVEAAPTEGAARFLVRQEAERSLVVALRGQVGIAAATAATAASGERAAQLLAQGEGAWLAAGGIEPATDLAATAAAWEQGRLTVYDRPLGEVVAALGRYRRGFVRVSSAAARLRVYGSYPLDDTDRALAILAETLSVAVHVHSGGWLVRIEAA